MNDAVDAGCEFCREIADPPRTANRIMWENEDFVSLPTKGCFVPGYCLLLPRNHRRSFADLPPADLRHCWQIMETMRELITTTFGPTIVAEHGPGAIGSRSCACMDHAHLHFVPVDPLAVSKLYREIAGEPQILRGPEDLASWSGSSYVALSPMTSVYWIWPHSRVFVSQFVRRICAQILGYPDFFDWALFEYRENMLLTRVRLEPLFRDNLPQRPPAAAA